MGGARDRTSRQDCQAYHKSLLLARHATGKRSAVPSGNFALVPEGFLWDNVRPEHALYVDDLAELCMVVMEKWHGEEPVNAGSGREITIKALSELVAKTVGYEGAILWDESRPNGTPRKLLDISRSLSLGWKPKTELEDGIRLAYRDFLDNPIRTER